MSHHHDAKLAKHKAHMHARRSILHKHIQNQPSARRKKLRAHADGFRERRSARSEKLRAHVDGFEERRSAHREKLRAHVDGFKEQRSAHQKKLRAHVDDIGARREKRHQIWRDHADKFKERVASKRDEMGARIEAKKDAARGHLKDAHDHIHQHFSQSQTRIANHNLNASGDGSADIPEENERVVPDVLPAYMQIAYHNTHDKGGLHRAQHFHDCFTDPHAMPADMSDNFSANNPDVLKKNKKPTNWIEVVCILTVGAVVLLVLRGIAPKLFILLVVVAIFFVVFKFLLPSLQTA